MWDEDQCVDEEQIFFGIHWGDRCREEMDGQESHGMGGVRGDPHRVSHKHQQSAYSGLQNSLHQEWSFVQQVTPGIGNNIGLVEKALRETFMPELFGRLGKGAA